MLAIALLAVIAAVLISTLGGGSKHHASRQASTGEGPTASAASYLGVGAATVRRRLRSGETLAEIADSTPGRSSRGLLRAMLAERAAELTKQGLSPAAGARPGEPAAHEARGPAASQATRRRLAGGSLELPRDRAKRSCARSCARGARSRRSPPRTATRAPSSIEGIVGSVERGSTAAAKAGQITAARASVLDAAPAAAPRN